MPRRRPPQPNYYLQRQHHTHQQNKKRTPEHIANTLLKHIDLDHITHTLNTPTNPQPPQEPDATHRDATSGGGPVEPEGPYSGHE